VDVSALGHLAPGESPGVLTTGDLLLKLSSRFDVEIASALGAAFDHVDVTGSVTIEQSTTSAGAALDIIKFGTAALNDGDELVIINNDGNDPVQGTFKDMPEGTNLGSNFLGTGLTAKITYVGGDGNDVSIKLSPGSLFPWHNDVHKLDTVPD